ncbi:MAG: DNA polymerase I [Coriobacteriia bacterium]|nr:DNA polymerase I [Coriobacteriia bacterium]
MPKTIAVIDGNSLMHRAYHAVPPTMNAPDGTHTNAVFGFLSMLFKFIDTAKPDAIFCAFDVGKPKFRLELMEKYKAQRPPMDQELREQFPVIDDVLTALGIPVVKMPGWEGDDILGSIAAQAEARGWDCLLVTGDKDANQLATEHVSIVNTKKGISDIIIYTPAMVQEKYGVSPEQFPDFLGFMGDKVDNIPGVPGIGEKTAAKLLQRFGSMEGVYENLGELKGKQKENIENNREEAFLSRTVATIVTDLELPAEVDLEGTAFPSFDADEVRAAFAKIGMRTHLVKALRYAGVDEGPEAQAAQQAVKIEFDASAVLHDDAAKAFVDEAAALGKTVGVAWREGERDSLFGSGMEVAVSGADGVAALSGDDAVWALQTLLRSATVVAYDFKALVQAVFPKDSSLPADVDAKTVARAHFFDVTLAAYALDSGAKDYPLADLADRYLHAALPETGDDEQAALALEAVTLRLLRDALQKALDDDGSLAVYRDFDAPLVPVLAQMERTGAALDTDALAELGTFANERIVEYRQQIFEAAGEEFNIDSPKQVGHILFEVMGMKALKKTARGFSTDASVLTKLAESADLANGHPEVPQLILDYREFAKVQSTYIDALPKMRAGDGRIHTSFNETVTTTGRLSSSDPNLQNIPVRTDFGRHIRECFVPLAPGERFLSADYSQIELRLLAHLSEDEHLIAAFKSGEDFHAETAARVFGVPVADVTPQMRSRAKAVNFGIVYGQQAYGLSQSLRISFGEAQEMIDRYFSVYPQVRAYLDAVVAKAAETGYAETMFGRKRHIPELMEGNRQRRQFGERTAMNHPMQGSAADIIKKAMADVQRKLAAGGYGAKMLLQVHDELCFSVPEAEMDAVRDLVKETMEGVVDLRVPLVVDAQYGDNWGQAH